MKPYLFYWMIDSQQGSERAGGQYLHYRIVNDISADDAFKKYIEYLREETEIKYEYNSYKKVAENMWCNYFMIYAVELPYDVYSWKEFNELKISTTK